MNADQLRIFAEILATQTRIIAMQAENQLWCARGHEPCYAEKDFEAMACQLDTLAQETMRVDR